MLDKDTDKSSTDTKNTVNNDRLSHENGYRVMRTIVALLFGVVVAGYIVGIIFGYIQKQNQLDSVALWLIVITGLSIVIMVNQKALQGLEFIEWGSLTIRLRKLKNEFEIQRSNLNTIQEILLLLINKDERSHLINLLNHKTNNYKGSRALQRELRRLRSMELIETQNEHSIADIKVNTTMDLSKYVQLTERGTHWTKLMVNLLEQTSESSQSPG